MAKTIINEEIYVEATRDGNDYLTFCSLMERLGWTHYPTHVTAEEIDAGNDSEEAESETIEVPADDHDIFDLLDRAGLFDDL